MLEIILCIVWWAGAIFTGCLLYGRHKEEINKNNLDMFIWFFCIVFWWIYWPVKLIVSIIVLRGDYE
jgi:hypothetical protein